MKVVILAAGKGTRLGKKAGPKPLTILENGKSILQMQMESLSKFVPAKNIIIVVGYCKEMIMDLFPDVFYIYNPNYAQENTSKSLLRAVEKIDDDLLWLNGDVVFHPSALKKMLESQKNCMLVNHSVVDIEEVKYRTDGHGRILEVSKQVQNPEGEALGINYFKKNDLPTLLEELKLCNANDYFEKAVEGALKKKVEIFALPINQDLCVEIDFYEDIARVNALMKNWC